MIPDHVLAQWELTGSQVKLGKGLINDTYCVDDRFVLQRINKQVFNHPVRVISNFQRVFNYIIDLVPRIIPTVQGEHWFEDHSKDVWKCSVYYPSRNFQTLPDELVFGAGQAFGLLLQRLRNCTVSLEPVLPNFHEFNHYLNELQQVARGTNEQLAHTLVARYRNVVNNKTPRSPRQIIHGDCKVDNILFDLQCDKVVRIVDTDTLMWGYPIWDFGDLVRSIATGCVHANLRKERLHWVCTGFFGQFSITEKEVEDYAFAPAYMSMMLGVRFFTDHIRGNQYFRVNRVGENMDRATVQFELAEKFISIQNDLQTAIYESIKGSEKN